MSCARSSRNGPSDCALKFYNSPALWQGCFFQQTAKSGYFLPKSMSHAENCTTASRTSLPFLRAEGSSFLGYHTLRQQRRSISCIPARRSAPFSFHRAGAPGPIEESFFRLLFKRRLQRRREAKDVEAIGPAFQKAYPLSYRPQTFKYDSEVRPTVQKDLPKQPCRDSMSFQKKRKANDKIFLKIGLQIIPYML